MTRRRRFAGRADAVAPSLLGYVLARRTGQGVLRGRIIEVEAYLGIEDDCCHTYQGRSTPRVASMYLGGGHAYVYRIYGVHWCFNVVTGRVGEGAAVLIRAVEPIDGLVAMRSRRGDVRDRDLCAGPGRICQAMGIDDGLDGVDLRTSTELWIERGAPPTAIVRSRRIGMNGAARMASAALRFCDADARWCSRPVRDARPVSLRR